MAEWKKIITSGSDTEISNLIVSNTIKGKISINAICSEDVIKGNVLSLSSQNLTPLASLAKGFGNNQFNSFSLGLANNNAISGSEVEVILSGIFKGVNLSSYDEGDNLFISPNINGSFISQNQLPSSPQTIYQYIGTVIDNGINGSILVQPKPYIPSNLYTPLTDIVSLPTGSKILRLDDKGQLPANSYTSTKLSSSVSITITGDVTGSTTFDGSQNISINVTGSNLIKLTPNGKYPAFDGSLITGIVPEVNEFDYDPPDLANGQMYLLKQTVSPIGEYYGPGLFGWNEEINQLRIKTSSGLKQIPLLDI